MQLSLNYRCGPLSVDERPVLARRHAGRRSRARRQADERPARNAAVRYPVRAATLLAVGDVALPAFGAQYGDALCVQRVVGRHAGAPGALLDGEAQVHRTYGEGLILVRPDGYLGYTGLGGTPRLGRYLQRFFG